MANLGLNTPIREFLSTKRSFRGNETAFWKIRFKFQKIKTKKGFSESLFWFSKAKKGISF